jgi:hypothetical protein
MYFEHARYGLLQDWYEMMIVVKDWDQNSAMPEVAQTPYGILDATRKISL